MKDDTYEYLESLQNDIIEGEEEEEPTRLTYQAILDAPRDLPDPVDLTREHLKEIEEELGVISLCWPPIDNPEFENRVNFPKSYVENSNKEKLLLLYAENFRRQFSVKYPKSKSLFLAAANECGLKKMVCTTIRPTTLPYTEIETWESCAKFIGSNLRFEPLEVPTLIPKRLYSPHTVFLRQSGQSHELATALCSLLLGLGYDAYVVFGYAARDITLRIMTRVDPPAYLTAAATADDEQDHDQDEDKIASKYPVKPPKDLRSKFLLMMEQREVDKKQAEVDHLAQIERERILKEEEPPFDELEGSRIHAWVLLSTGGRQIQEKIFIEPSTGMSYPLDTRAYSGIECVWNNVNYWINMQDCFNGLGTIDYDLSNVQNWEHFLIGEPLQWRQTKVDLDMDDDEIVLAKILEEKHLDMPLSWSMKITIPHEVLAQRFPGGVNKTWYKRTLIEEYASYVQEDGLVTKIIRYLDFENTVPLSVEALYENRTDKMIKVVLDIQENTITEYFARGREDAAKKFIYCGDPNNSASKKTIEFYHEARHDCLSKLELEPEHMTEYYDGRENFLYYRDVYYAKKGQPPPGFQEGSRRIAINVVEKFLRNDKVPVSQDVATREFAIVEREVRLKYHYGRNKITASTRTFQKPKLAETGQQTRFNPQLTFGYEAEIGAKPPRQLQLFLLMEKMIGEEINTLAQIRDVEDQIDVFLTLRHQEMAFPKLEVPLFNRQQNEQYRQGMLEREKEERENREKEVEDEMDYLAPYLAKLGYPESLTSKQITQVIRDCLADFKQMLVYRANDIQHQYEQWTAFLKRRQHWYVTNKATMKEKEELDYFQEVNDLNFLLQILVIRLTRHKELSGPRYEALVRYLKHHKLLSRRR